MRHKIVTEIKRVITTEERFFEVLHSVPKLCINYREYDAYVPEIRVEFWNYGGVVSYRYSHQGVIGYKDFLNKLKELHNE